MIFLYQSSHFFTFYVSELDNLLGDTQCEITGLFVNPLSPSLTAPPPKSYQHLVSPHGITSESNKTAITTEEIIVVL